METTEITDSILNSVKKLMGSGVEHAFFDADLIMHINSALMILCQIGIGKNNTPFRIYDETSTWQDFMDNADWFLGAVEYVYLRCKLVFDPPTSSFVLSAMKETMNELEWRLNVMAETPTWSEEQSSSEEEE